MMKHEQLQTATESTSLHSTRERSNPERNYERIHKQMTRIVQEGIIRPCYKGVMGMDGDSIAIEREASIFAKILLSSVLQMHKQLEHYDTLICDDASGRLLMPFFTRCITALRSDGAPERYFLAGGHSITDHRAVRNAVRRLWRRQVHSGMRRGLFITEHVDTGNSEIQMLDLITTEARRVEEDFQCDLYTFNSCPSGIRNIRNQLRANHVPTEVYVGTSIYEPDSFAQRFFYRNPLSLVRKSSHSVYLSGDKSKGYVATSWNGRVLRSKRNSLSLRLRSRNFAVGFTATPIRKQTSQSRYKRYQSIAREVRSAMAECGTLAATAVREKNGEYR